jgi:DNA-binding NarL/FixJ family response regulator
MTHPSENTVATALFAFVALAIGVDLVTDARSGVALSHTAAELLAAAASFAGSLWFSRKFLEERAVAAQWRARAEELLSGVGSTVDRQLDAWSLTPAEQEVARLLLKGLSHKEIATVRDTSERTAREQASAVYKKAGVAGRAELSAWFLEDLMDGGGASPPSTGIASNPS